MPEGDKVEQAEQNRHGSERVPAQIFRYPSPDEPLAAAKRSAR